MSNTKRGAVAFYKDREDEVRAALAKMTIAQAAKYFNKSIATISDAKRKLGMVGKRNPGSMGISTKTYVSAKASIVGSNDIAAENRVLRQLLADANLEIAKLTLRA